MSDDFMNSRQVRDFLRCSRSTFQRLRRLGLPSERLPDRRLMFEEGEVMAWLREHRPRRARIAEYQLEKERRMDRALAAREALA